MVLGHIIHSQQVKHCHPEGFTPEGSYVIEKRSFVLNIHTFPGILILWSRLLMCGQAFLHKVSVPSLLALLCLLHTGTAHAACSNPPGVEGEQIYNSTHKVMQYCDETHWTAMRATGKLDKAGDTMTGPLNLSGAPIASNEAATKEYVDTVMASGGGGGKSVTCSVICNGICPTAPSGWTLAQSTGLSGSNVISSAGQTSNSPTGRCYGGIHRNGPPYYSAPRNMERMCCYFQD